MKGIILAGGSGTRLYPVTRVISKQLLPIYDKPMIYYPLSTLMLAGIRDIILITTPIDLPLFRTLLGDGNSFGINLSYVEQRSPNGIAEAIILAKDHINDEDICLMLGDNLLVGAGLSELLQKSIKEVERTKNAKIFGYRVGNPSDFGVAQVSNNMKVIGLEEKPKSPKSNIAVIGLYMYPNGAMSYARDLKPSNRGELEITDLNKKFLSQKRLDLQELGRGYAWLDTGTFENLTEATEFIKVLEKKTNRKIGCLEEIALRKNWINVEDVQITSPNSSYGSYLKSILHEF